MSRLARLPQACAALALLAGCITDPQQLVDGAVPREFASAAAPRALADCTAHNASAFSVDYSAYVVERVRPENFQVVVTRPRWQYEPVLVARTAPAPGGAQLLLYTPKEMGEIEAADWTARLRRGC